MLRAHEADPISALVLAELVAETFPPGVWNIVSGVVPAVGAALAGHPDVRRIVFTGSVADREGDFQVGGRRAAGSRCRSSWVGRNPLVVFPDADLEGAVEAAVGGMNFTATAGQSCSDRGVCWCTALATMSSSTGTVPSLRRSRWVFLWTRMPKWVR